MAGSVDGGRKLYNLGPLDKAIVPQYKLRMTIILMNVMTE